MSDLVVDEDEDDDDDDVDVVVVKWLLSDHVSLPYLLYHWSRAIFFIVAILQG